MENGDMDMGLWSSINLESLTCIKDGIRDGDIPVWLLTEVLIKLPLKLVCSSKLVSRQWLSLISSSSLVRTYISRASSLPQSWMFVSRNLHFDGSECSQFPEYQLLSNVYSSQVLKCMDFCVLPLPSSQAPSAKRYRILGISNGLVLYSCQPLYGKYHNLMQNYYICNPFTGKWIELPKPCGHLGWSDCGFVANVKDGILKSYIVVFLDCSGQTSGFIKSDVFFSEAGEWKSFNVVVSDVAVEFLALRKEAVVLNEILHWIAQRHGIIAYDPCKNPSNVRVIPFPSDSVNNMRDLFSNLSDVCRGKLTYFEIYVPYFGGQIWAGDFQMWVLDEYESGDWRLHHRINYSSLLDDVHLLSPLLFTMCFHPFDSDIVYLGNHGVFVSYNMKTRKLQALDLSRCGKSISKKFPRWWKAPLLVIPPWPISLSRPSFGGAVED